MQGGAFTEDSFACDQVRVFILVSTNVWMIVFMQSTNVWMIVCMQFMNVWMIVCMQSMNVSSVIFCHGDQQLCVSIHACTHVYAHTCIYAHIHTIYIIKRDDIFSHDQIHTYIHTYIHVCMCASFLPLARRARWRVPERHSWQVKGRQLQQLQQLRPEPRATPIWNCPCILMCVLRA